MALIVALCVPIANVAAVWSLARHGGHAYLRELSRNPLNISTVAGLLAVGAGLKLGGLKRAPGLAAALLAIRHAVLQMLSP